MQHKDRRQDILKAAMELFAVKGFRGTTTRDLAAKAEVNEAIIFRYFNTKEELYHAILEGKMKIARSEKLEELCHLAETGDDAVFLQAFGDNFLERHEQDGTFMRLLMFSALEGHELSEMFINSMPERDPLAGYFQKRIEDGIFKSIDPNLAARAFVGMFFAFIQAQEIFGLKAKQSFDRQVVVKTFVSIFLSGMKS